MKKFKWKNFIASLLAFCLMISQCAITAQATETETQEVKAGTFAYYKPEGSSEFLEYGDAYEHVEAIIPLFSKVTVKIEEDGVPLRFDLDEGSTWDYDGVSYSLNEDETELTAYFKGSEVLGNYCFSAAAETDNGGYLHYSFDFYIKEKVNYPENAQPFNGTVKALAGQTPERYQEVDLDSFAIVADRNNNFGLAFYDENGEKISTDRIVPVVENFMPAYLFDVSAQGEYYKVSMLKQFNSTIGYIGFIIDDTFIADVEFNINEVPGYDPYKFQGYVWGYYNNCGTVLNEGDVFSNDDYYPQGSEISLGFINSNNYVIPASDIFPSESTAAIFEIEKKEYHENIYVSIPNDLENGVYELTFYLDDDGEKTATVFLPVGEKVYPGADEIESGYIITYEDGKVYTYSFDDYIRVPSFEKLKVQMKSPGGEYLHFNNLYHEPIEGIEAYIDPNDSTIFYVSFMSTETWGDREFDMDTSDGMYAFFPFVEEVYLNDNLSESTCLAYEYDPTAPNGLGQSLNEKGYSNYTKYRPGDVVEVIFTDEKGNLIDVSDIIPTGGISTSEFAVSRLNDEPSRLRVKIDEGMYGNALYHMPVLVNGYLKTFYMPVEGRKQFEGVVYYLDDAGEYQVLESDVLDAPVFKKQVLKFKYNESDTEYISDFRSSMALEECFGGILEDGYGVYFKPSGTYFLGNDAPTGSIKVFIGDDYYYSLRLNYTTYDVSEDAEYKDGIFVEFNGIPSENYDFAVHTYPRVDFCDEKGNLIDAERIIPCTDGITDYLSIWYEEPSEDNKYYTFSVNNNAPLGEQIFKFGYIEEDGKISYFEAPINIVEESGGGDYPGPGGDDGESSYLIFPDGPYLIVEGYGNVRITAQDLAARMEEEEIDPEEITMLCVYAWEEGSILGDGEESILSLFPNLGFMEVYVNTVDDYALSGSDTVEEAYLGIRHLGDGVFANNKNLSYVHMEMINSAGWGVFAGCPKLKIAANGVYRGCDYANIQFDRSHYDYTGYTYVPANLFSGSDLEYAYIFNINRLEENVFAETNLKQIYFNDGIAQPIGMANIDNAFEGATIGTVGFLGSEEDWNESVQITGDLQYNKFAEKRRVAIETFNAGTLIDYGDWTDYDDNVIGTVYSDGQVVFSGEGAIGEGSIQEINFSNGDVEYYNHSPWSSAKSIVIEEGITSIGTNAFRYMEELEEVIIADGLEIIGENAFAECEYLHMISLPTTLKVIGRDAFANIDKWSENGTYFYYSGTQNEWEAIENAGSLPEYAIVNSDYLPFMMGGLFMDINSGSKIRFYGADGEFKEVFQPKVGDTIRWEAEAADGYKLGYLFVGNRSVFKNDYYSGSFVVGWNTDVEFGFQETEDEEVVLNGTCGSKVTWEFKSGTLTLSGSGATTNYTEGKGPFEEFKDSIKNIVVGEGITTIGDYMFAGFLNTKSVSLPSTLTTIGNYNFIDYQLSSIEFPSKLKKIGDYAFVGAKLKGNVEIPATVEYIGKAAFGECPDIEGFVIEEGNKKYKYVDGYLLTMDGKTLVKATRECLIEDCMAALIPEGVETIGLGAFIDVTGLEGVEFPVSLKKIEDLAFAGLTEFNKMLVHPGLTTIGADVFAETAFINGYEWYDPYVDQTFVYDGMILYTGTDAQFKKIESKLGVKKYYVVCDYVLMGDVTVTTKTFEPIGNNLKIQKGFDDVEGYWLARVENGYNPITNTEIDRSFTVSSSNEDVAEVYFEGVNLDGRNEFTDKAYIRYVLKGAGKTEITLISNEDSSKTYKISLEVSQRANDVSVTWAGLHTKDDQIMLIPDVKKDIVNKATISWIGGSAWSDDEYKFVALNNGVEFTLPEGITLNEKTGELKLVKGFDTSILSEDERTFEIMLMADSDPDDDIPYEISFVKEVVIYDAKASEINFIAYGEYNTAYPIIDKVILDPSVGKTECDIYAVPYNMEEISVGYYDEYGRYNEVELSATSNPNFEVTENEDGSLHVKLLGNTGSITITAKTMDGGNKTKKIVVSAGTMVRGIDVTSTLLEVGESTYVIAKGKSATLSVDVLPAAPTNKKIYWMVHPNYIEYLTVNNGKITAKKVCEDPIRVMALAVDGSCLTDYVDIYVTEPVTNIEIYEAGTENIVKNIELEMIYDAQYSLDAGAFALLNGNKDFESVYGDVEWSVKGSIAKNVYYYTDGNTINFSVDKPGTFTLRASALDGSGKYAEVKVTVKQLPSGVNMTASGTSGVYLGDYETWLFKGDLKKGITVKPTVKFTAFNPVDSKSTGYKLYLAEGWIETWEAVSEENLVVDAKGNPAKQLKLMSATETSAKYTLTLVSDKVESLIYGVYIQVEPKDSIILEELTVEPAANMFATYDNEDRYIMDVATATKVELKERLNGALVTKVSKDIIKSWSSEWVTVNGAKSYLTVPAGTEPGLYDITLTYTDAKNPENTISDTFWIKVSEKIKKENIDLVLAYDVEVAGITYEEGTSIRDLGAALTPEAGEIHFVPKIVSVPTSPIDPEGFDVAFSFSQLTTKVAEGGVFYDMFTGSGGYMIRPLAPGKATLKIKVLDGSNVEQTINFSVSNVASPVTGIVSSSTGYTLGLYSPMVIGYNLKSTGSVPTIADMEWTVSDESILSIDDLGVDTYNPMIEKIDVKKGIVYYQSEGQLRLIPQGKAGKVTVTGKTTDGSNKTIKYNITVAKNTTAYAVDISAPVTAATGGEQGTVVVPWGKSLKLTASLMPNKAKNAIVNYSIIGVEDKDSNIVTLDSAQLSALGVTINKSGSISTKAPSAKMVNPYVGWVKVTATLNYKDAGGNAIEDSIYVYIDRPVSKMTLMEDGKKVNGITVTKSDIDGEPLQIDMLNTYDVTVEYKGFKDQTTVEAKYGSADNLLWTSSNNALASVDQNGIITVNEFTKAGSVTITATAQDGSGVKFTYKVTIKK